MTEVTDNNEQGNEPQQQGSTPSPQTQNSEHMIPKSRFDEVNNKYRELSDKLAAMETERQQQEQQSLEEQNRFRELYEQTKAQLEALEQVKETAERFRGSLQATNESRIAQIPEDKHHLVPEFDDPVALSAWLDKAMPDLVTPAKPKAPGLDGGSGTNTNSQAAPLSATHDALADVAAQYGYEVDKERIAEYAKQSTSIRDTGE